MSDKPLKSSDLREKTDEDLRELLVSGRKGLFNLRFRSATDRVERTSEFGRIRRDVARILTVLNERRRTAARKPAVASKSAAPAAR